MVRPMFKMIQMLVIALLMCVIAAGFAAAYAWNWMHSEFPVEPGNRVIIIERGSALPRVARQLEDRGLVKFPVLWRLYARFLAPAPVKAGEYELDEFVSPYSLLVKFQSGKVITYGVTLVEGLTFADFVKTLAKAPKLQVLLPPDDLESQLRLLELDLSHPEGWFFPDTYRYIAGETDVSILKRAHGKMRSTLQLEWEGRQPGLPYQSPEEALIMASIIEKETGVPYERGTIAGVFVRRLQRGMRLQTDPTVIYGLGLEYQGNITRAHLRRATPYNTYVIKGLPPTPIAMPGLAAIRAAMHPEAGDALYFVAKGDGSHQFSVTIEEHNEAVANYQKRKRAPDYRSAPGPESRP